MPDQSQILPQLDSVIQGTRNLYPEICLVGIFVVLIVSDLLFRNSKFLLPGLSLSGMVLVFVLELVQLLNITEPNNFLFFKFLHLNQYEVIFKLLFAITSICSIWMTIISPSLDKEKIKGEYYSIMVAIVLGLNLLVMSCNLLMIYLSLEVVSIGSYILTSFSFNKKSAESGLKYILFGAFSSGMMLYGISFFYGFTGSLNFFEPSFLEALKSVNPIMVTGAGCLILAGFLFKISAFPFHLWTPDVYEGAPTPIVAFFSIAPKAAGFAVIINFTYPFFYNQFSAIPIIDWKMILGIIAIGSLTIGNFAALGQNNVKRLLAYSSIAHAGFILAGLMAFSQFGVRSVIFYLIAYLPMNFAAFAMVEILSRKTGSEDVRKFKGLGGELPFIGVIFVLIMIALTGLPPTVGFNAKLLTFSALWEAYQNSGEKILLWVFVAGLLNSVVALFYYLKIPYYMYLKTSEGRTAITNETGLNIFISVMCLPLLVFFFKPDWLMDFIQKIILNF